MKTDQKSIVGKQKSVFIVVGGLILLVLVVSVQIHASFFVMHMFMSNNFSRKDIAAIMPEQSYNSQISLNGVVAQLSAEGILDASRLKEIAEKQGMEAVVIEEILKEENSKIILTSANASLYLKLLWPLGIANYLEINENGPLATENLFRFASTGGWTLGEEKNGGAYYNKFALVSLSEEQERLVQKVANQIYRPCCNNSTFFQDCNHGSAMVGLITLGAAQGLTEDELFQEALAFNSYWFPQHYQLTKKYVENIEKRLWSEVDSSKILSYDYSSGSGWAQNVKQPLIENNLLENNNSSVRCAV